MYWLTFDDIDAAKHPQARDSRVLTPILPITKGQPANAKTESQVNAQREFLSGLER